MDTNFNEKQQSEVGELVDMPLGNFIDKVKPENLGYILSLKNFLNRLYFDLKSKVDGAVQKAKDLPKDTKERNELNWLINNLYSKMQMIEDKVVWLQREAERRSIDLTN